MNSWKRFKYRWVNGCDPDDTFGKGPPEKKKVVIPTHPNGTFRIITEEKFPYKFIVQEYQVRYFLERIVSSADWFNCTEYKGRGYYCTRQFDTEEAAENFIDTQLKARREAKEKQEKLKSFVAAHPPRIYP